MRKEEKDYWEECIAIAADEVSLTLTEEQIQVLAKAAAYGHECYGQSFYTPPARDYYSGVEDDLRKKIKDLQRELDEYRDGAAKAVRRAGKIGYGYDLRVHKDGSVDVF